MPNSLLSLGLLALAPLCGFALPASARAATTQDADDAERQLRDSDDRERQAAVKALAERGDRAAWELVLGALDDRSARVADEAQLQLGALRDPELAVELLFGKRGLAARDPWVRVRCAEALGRVAAPLPLDSLAAALGDKDAAVRRTLCWTAERIADAGRAASGTDGFEELASRLDRLAGRDREPAVRARALVARAALVGARGEEVEAALGAREPLVRSAALVAAGRLADAELRVALGARGARDASHSVRVAALRLLRGVGTRSAAGALVDALEVEASERVAWHLVAALRELSGLRHRVDPRPWRAWVEGLPEGWVYEAPEAKAGRAGRDGSDADTATFVGLPLRSQRVAFLIDFSGSMWEERPGRRSRKEAVDEELGRALRALQPEARFNVIPYTAAPIPWEDALVEAQKGRVAKALDWFEKRRDRGTGNYWDALLLALEDEQVDTVFVLTDGAPTGGRRWNLGLMADLFAELDRFHGVTVQAVLVDAQRGLTRHWETMCHTSGGEVLEAEL